MFKHIVIATDGSDLSREAMRKGIDLAQSLDARVTLFTASPPFRVYEAEDVITEEPRESDSARADRIVGERLRPAEAHARSKGVAVTLEHVFAEHPFEAIIEAAERGGCDLIFMASHGRRGLASLLLGSETQKVLVHSKLPVLVFR